MPSVKHALPLLQHVEWAYQGLAFWSLIDTQNRVL